MEVEQSGNPGLLLPCQATTVFQLHSLCISSPSSNSLFCLVREHVGRHKQRKVHFQGVQVSLLLFVHYGELNQGVETFHVVRFLSFIIW